MGAHANFFFWLDTGSAFALLVFSSCVKVFRINPEFKILRLTFHGSQADFPWKVSLKMLN